MQFGNRECGSYLAERGVTRLLHLTEFRRLSHILELGLIPSSRSNRPERVHLSIQYPNLSLFEKQSSRNYAAVITPPSLCSRSDANFTPSSSIRSRALPLSGIASLRTLFHEEVIVSNRFSVRRHPSHPTNMPTSLMAEVILRERVPPSEFSGLVFATLDSVILYESLYGAIPAGISWTIDSELQTEDRIFSFWQDTDDPEGHDWIHHFADRARLINRKL